jgi:uncharacterized membrane protein
MVWGWRILRRASGPERGRVVRDLVELVGDRSTELKKDRRRLGSRGFSPNDLKASRIRVRASAEQIASKLKELPSLYVVLALTVGTFLVFAQPPGQGLDEVRHFYRVWTFASGSFIDAHGRAGGPIPQCVSDYMNHFASAASGRGPFSFRQYWQSPQPCSSRLIFGSYGTAAFNAPIAYLPEIVAVALLRAVSAPIPLIFFAGRLATLLAFVGIFYLAIRLIPMGKQVLFVLGLFPTTLLLASTYSADPMPIALAVLAISLTLRCRRSQAPDKHAFLWLFLVLAALTLTKPTMFIFAPLLFMVPAPRIGRMRVRPLIVQVSAAAVVVVLAGVWTFLTRHIKIGNVYGLNPHKQLEFILHDPFGYAWVLARTFFESMGEARWLPGFVFSIGFPRPSVPDNVYAPVGLVIVGALTLWYAYQLQIGEKHLANYGKLTLAWLPIVLAVVGIILVETTLFVYGTPLGQPVTDAQGRYFYPFVALPLLTIDCFRRERHVSHSARWIIAGSVIMLAWLVIKIFVHDYNL